MRCNKKLMLASLVSLILSGCGGSGGDTPQPVVGTDTAQLKNNAAAAIGSDFDGSISAVGRMFNQNRDVVVGTTGDVVAGGSDEFPEDIETDLAVQDTVQALVRASLSAAEGSSGVTTRSGNTITIDPDEQELCNNDLLSADEDELFTDLDQSELDKCRELVADLTVQLVASGEESGEVNYLFKNESMLKIGYAPGSESIELDLGGLKTFGSAYEEIYSDEFSEQDAFPAVMTGAVKVATTTTNSTAGQEAGSVTMDIIRPINIVTAASQGEEQVTMAPGNLYAITADAATGVGSLSFDIGAISAAFQDEGQLGNLNLAGFSGRADVNPNDGTFIVSNLGMSRGPFSVSLDNKEVLKVTLESFGFEVSEQSAAITISGDLNLSMFLDSIDDLGLEDPDITNAMISMMAPSGTAFSRAGNGAVQIGGTGPFSVTIGATGLEGNYEESVVTVNSGECVESFTPNEEDVPSTEKCL